MYLIPYAFFPINRECTKRCIIAVSTLNLRDQKKHLVMKRIPLKILQITDQLHSTYVYVYINAFVSFSHALLEHVVFLLKKMYINYYFACMRDVFCLFTSFREAN